LKNVSLCNRSCEPGNGGFQWFSCWRALSPPFVAFFSGISTVFELIVIAMVIADAKTDPEKKQFLDQDHVRALLAVPTKPTRVDPDRAIRLQRRAEEAKSAGDLEGAIRLFGRAIRHTPYNAALFLLRGSALLEVNRPKDAAKDFVAGLELDPGNQTLTFTAIRPTTTRRRWRAMRYPGSSGFGASKPDRTSGLPRVVQGPSQSIVAGDLRGY
jgi:hypothetical protein